MMALCMPPSTSTCARPKRAGSRFSRPITCSGDARRRSARATRSKTRVRPSPRSAGTRSRAAATWPAVARRCWSTARPTVPACRSPSPARGPRGSRGRRPGPAHAAAPDGHSSALKAWWKSKRVGIDLDRPGLGLGRRRHVVIGAERSGDVLERAGIARRRDQPFAVERTGERARLRAGGAAMRARWRATARRVVAVPVDVQAAQDRAQAVAVGNARSLATLRLGVEGIAFVRRVGQGEHDTGLLVDGLERAQALAHRERHHAVRGVVVEGVARARTCRP